MVSNHHEVLGWLPLLSIDCVPVASINTKSAREKANPKESHAFTATNSTDQSYSLTPCGLPLPTSRFVPCARLSLRSKFRAHPQWLRVAVVSCAFQAICNASRHCSNIVATCNCRNVVAMR